MLTYAISPLFRKFRKLSAHTYSTSFISLIFKKVVIRDTMPFNMKVLPYGLVEYLLKTKLILLYPLKQRTFEYVVC